MLLICIWHAGGYVIQVDMLFRLIHNDILCFRFVTWYTIQKLELCAFARKGEHNVYSFST